LEDRRIGRIYLPATDLERFGVRMELDETGSMFTDDEDGLLALIAWNGIRAERWYREGLALLPELDHRSAACCGAMAEIYHRLLARMMARPWDVLRSRMSLPAGEKLLVASRALAGAR
ncbi:MAG: squalene/phytoene synthase family protein, partial [Sciscionella sp.]